MENLAKGKFTIIDILHQPAKKIAHPIILISNLSNYSLLAYFKGANEIASLS